MAKQRFKGALNTATFPFLSTLQPRTVVQPQLDINVRTPRNPNSTEDYTDYSIPQVLYCENVVPTGEGLQSVTYVQQVAGVATGTPAFDQAIILRDENENNYLFSPAGGLNYVYTANRGNWQSRSPNLFAAGRAVSRAYVNGRTFVCYANLGIYEYRPSTDELLEVLPLGLLAAEITGISSSSNYLLAFTKLTVHWSSLVDPLDFVPSLTTGAGFAIPQDVKANIVAVLGIAGGYVVYTAKNAVAAVYTNNVRAPFTFKEINNAGGITSYEQVTSEQNSGPHYAWTTGGLQKITIQGAEPVSAEVNDFIAGRKWEQYNATTQQLEEFVTANSEFPVKVAYLASRWLLLSYQTVDNAAGFNYVLVYDTILKRWGKLKVDHVDCFYYPYPTTTIGLTYQQLGDQPYSLFTAMSYSQLVSRAQLNPLSKLSISFLSSDGQVRIMEMDYNKTGNHGAVVIFGKFQLLRAALVTFQQMDIDGVYGAVPAVGLSTDTYVQTLLDGKEVKTVAPLFFMKGNSRTRKFAKRTTGIAFNIVCTGTFALTSYVLEVTQDGDR